MKKTIYFDFYRHLSGMLELAETMDEKIYDNLLDFMDDLWWAMTEEERDLFQNGRDLDEKTI